MRYKTITHTPSINLDAHATGDVVAALEEITDWAMFPGGSSLVKSVVVNDATDSGVALDLVFFTATGSIGAESAAYTTTDAVAATHAGTINVAAANFDDAVDNKSATQAEDIVIGCAPGSTSIWMGVVARGNIDAAAVTDLVIKIGLDRG
jgi:hypothetical protein